MSYFGKFYLVGPEATKAANWLFTADVSKAPGTGSAPLCRPRTAPLFRLHRLLPCKDALGNHVSHQIKPRGTQTGFSFECCFGRGYGKRVRVSAFPVLTGGWILPALWLQLWLTAGDVMGAGVNQAQPSPAAVRTGRSCPFLRGWEAAHGMSEDAAAAPHIDLKGKKHDSSPPPGAGTPRVGQGIPRLM